MTLTHWILRQIQRRHSLLLESTAPAAHRLSERVQVTDGEQPHLIYGQSDRHYRLSVNQHFVLWPEDTISEEQLRRIGHIADEHQLVLRRKGEDERVLEAGETIQLATAGSDIVYSVPGTEATLWTLNVQGVLIQSDIPKIHVREAVLKAGFDSDKHWIIVLKNADGKIQLEIDLSKEGIKKLRLTPREINNGDNVHSPGAKPAFVLLSSDDEGFRRRGIELRRVVEGNRRWLIFDDYPLPKGLSPQAVAMALEIHRSTRVPRSTCFTSIRLSDATTVQLFLKPRQRKQLKTGSISGGLVTVERSRDGTPEPTRC